MDDGTLSAVSLTQLLFLSADGSEKARYSYEGSHLDAFAFGADYAAVAAVTGSRGGLGTLTVLDASGHVLGSVSAPRHVESIAASEDRLLVLFTGEEATLFDTQLREIVSYQPEAGVNRIFLTHGGMGYFAGPEGVTQIDFGR